MGNITKFEKLILALTALFMAVCIVIFCFGADSRSVTVAVSERSPDSVFPEVSVQSDGTPDSLLPGEKIDLNTAPAADLARLPGIGDTRAEAIVAYRDEHGAFQTADDLLSVDGIGEVTLEKLRDFVKTQ